MSPIIVLITGANRGLGKGLLEQYLARPNYVVIAGNRDPEHSSSKILNDLPRGDGTKLITVKIDSTLSSDPSMAVQQLAAQGIHHLDIVIANAGISLSSPAVAELDPSDLDRHMEVNVYGVVRLFQAVLPLLRQSPTGNPKWVSMSSTAGNITNMIPIPNASYGTSKAALNWLTKRAHFENDDVTIFAISPGFIETDLGAAGAERLGLGNDLFDRFEDSIGGMVKIIDEATRETHGGHLWSFDGSDVGW